ncbi:MAG TPA: trigger factor [Solirubrobacterales bacterium]|nr:trigger factor [Solirubrobacterales bacterium]
MPAKQAKPVPAAVATEVTELPESKVKIDATVPAAEVDAQLQAAARSFAGEMRVPGFRKGKVPPELVLQRIGREAVMEEALREGLPGWYERALISSGVAPVGDPKLDMPEPPAEGDPLEFAIEVGVRPAAELGDYKGIEVGRPEPEVPAEAIDAELERMRESLAGLDPVERAAADGDFLLIDYAGTIDGEPFEGGSATDFLLELGSDTLIEGFNEQLAGSAAEEARTVAVTFPDDYGAEHLAGKEASFEVAVKEVREKRLPELDDDFAADNSDFDTLAELRDDIEARLAHQAEHRIEHQFHDDAIDAAVANATIDVPDDIAAARATEIWERVERSLQQRGMDPATYLQLQGKDRDEAIADARDDAVAGLKREAVLAAVAAAEDIEIGEEDLLEALAPPAGQKGKPEKLLKRIRAEGREPLLAEEIRMRKAAELIVAEATPIEMDRAAAREKLWTPEGEEGRRAAAGDLWTPGDE